MSYRCEYCAKTFENQRDYIEHLKEHKNKINASISEFYKNESKLHEKEKSEAKDKLFTKYNALVKDIEIFNEKYKDESKISIGGLKYEDISKKEFNKKTDEISLLSDLFRRIDKDIW